MTHGADDRESQETVRALILARRRRFIAAAVAGLGIAGGAGCDAFAPPPSDDPLPIGGSFSPRSQASGGPASGGPGSGGPTSGGPGDFQAAPIQGGTPVGPSPQDRCPDTEAALDDEDAGVGSTSMDAGVVAPCVCLLLSFVAPPEDDDSATST